MKVNLTFFYLFIFVLFIQSCGSPSFIIRSLDDKFTDKLNDPIRVIGQNNRLSTKSVHGGIHVDEKGVYLDPFVYKDRKTKELLSLGFIVRHFNFTSSYAGSSKFNPINEIVILVDKNDRIVLEVSQDFESLEKNNLKIINTWYNSSPLESGIALLSYEELRILAFAKNIEVKIVGGKQSQTYDSDDISSNFLSNIKSFFIQEVDSLDQGINN